jgi:hypothetical protein
VHMRYIELHSRVAFKVVFYKLLYWCVSWLKLLLLLSCDELKCITFLLKWWHLYDSI